MKILGEFFILLLNKWQKKTLKVIRNHKIVWEELHKKNFRPDRRVIFAQDNTKLLGEYEIDNLPNKIYGLSPEQEKNSEEPAYEYTMEIVWNTILTEIQDFIKPYIFPSGKSSFQKNPQLKKKNDNTIQFSFANSESFVNDYNGKFEQLYQQLTAEKRSKRRNIKQKLLPELDIKSSMYNVISVYQLLVNFSDQVNRSLKITEKSRIQIFLDEFLNNLLFPQLNFDFMEKLNNILNSLDAFKPREKNIHAIYSSEESNRPLLQSSIDIIQLVSQLFTSGILMPSYMENFLEVINQLLKTYFQVCQDQYDKVISGSESHNYFKNQDAFKIQKDDPIFISIHSKFSEEIEKDQNIQQNQARLSIQLTDSERRSSGSIEMIMKELEDKIEKFSQKEDLFEQKFLNNRKLEKNGLILESPRLILLANLSDSLDWVASCVKGFIQSSSQIDSLSHQTNPNHDKKYSKSREKILFNFHYHPKIFDSLNLLVSHFRKLSARCLLTLKKEYRFHCYYFLQQISNVNYALDQEPTEPDMFINELNKDLAFNEDIMTSFLPSNQKSYLFSGLARLISKTLVEGAREIKKINKNGIMRMVRNVFAIQQNLTNIVSSQEKHFEKVRHYYDLFNSRTPDNLIAFDIEHPNAFKPEEYLVINKVLFWNYPKNPAEIHF
eukprot:Anaeramoba_ignava/c19236_g1_i2.p1 GENE.c19236_g1_i2~~c19236_g1_i2.p1  ORF type:complete len:664 (+),score=219.57 c19236_g1_i2:1073-3064(+)